MPGSELRIVRLHRSTLKLEDNLYRRIVRYANRHELTCTASERCPAEFLAKLKRDALEVQTIGYRAAVLRSMDWGNCPGVGTLCKADMVERLKEWLVKVSVHRFSRLGAGSRVN